MPIQLRQHVGATVDAGQSVSCSVTMSATTLPNSLLYLVAASTHHRENNAALPNDPAGFTRVTTRKEDKLTVAIWRWEAASPTSRVTVQAGGETFTTQVRVLELTGVAQSGALDKVTIRGNNPEGQPGSKTPSSGATGALAQDDEVLIGVIVNRYASTSQSGFTGGLGQITQNASDSSEPDHDRTRLSVHGATTSSGGNFTLSGLLNSNRDWVAALVTFRGGSLGPARMTSKLQSPALRIGGRARLSAFGPLRSKLQPAAVTVTGRAWIGPFEHQMRIGGRTGLLIGQGTPYRIARVEGLDGWEIRSSDTPFARGDGDQRGVDLLASRKVLLQLNFDGHGGESVEVLTQRLLAAARPRRDEDFDVMFRLPGRPLQRLRCRPGSLSREMTAERLILADQALLLVAADPRIYSARSREVLIPVSGSGPVVTAAAATNIGNGRAYPVIRVTGAPDVQVTGLELVNVTGNVAFEWSGVLPPSRELIADMPAVVTSEPRPKITVDRQSKFGSWVSPREPFFLAPDPDAPSGVNAVYLRTTPASAAVTCSLQFDDTWVG